MSVNSQGPTSSLVPELAALGLPFLFPDANAAYRVVDGPVGQELGQKLGAVGLVSLGFWDNGIRHITNRRRPINRPDDLRGLRIRTPADPATIDTFQALGAATLLTTNAKGILPGGHPLLAGGLLPTPAIRDLIRSADVVLAVGTEIGETDFEYYGEGPIEVSGDFIRVDVEGRQLGRNATPTLPIIADAGLFAAALLPQLATGREGGAALAAAARSAGLAQLEPRIARHRPLIDMIWQTLPHAVLVGDSTEASYAAGLFAEPPAPRRFMSAATGFGTLGFALPAAIGARAGLPETPCLCLIGDGGLHYTLPELAAAAESALPVIVLLWNDERYGEIEKYMVRNQMQPVGVTLYPTRFALAVQAFGAEHVVATSLAEVGAALKLAADRKVVTVIEMDAGNFRAN
jgi:acetolactate synthase-1/2/3 large subunit